MRLFAALPVPEPVLTQCLHLQKGIDGRLVSPENLHITLVFLGELPDAEPVISVLSAMPAPEFVIETNGTGHFRKLWYLALQDNPALSDWVQMLKDRLDVAEIPFDHKRFFPHITLARNVKNDPVLDPEPVSGTADKAILFQSCTEEGRLIYKPLYVLSRS